MGLEVDRPKQPLHVGVIRAGVARPQPDVLIEIKGAATCERQPFGAVQPHQLGVHALDRAPGCEAEYELGFGAQPRGDKASREPRGVLGGRADENLHGLNLYRL